MYQILLVNEKKRKTEKERKKAETLSIIFNQLKNNR